MQDHLLFLSHSGSDTDTACLLKKRIEESSIAKKHNIKVWLDKHDLLAGKPWQNQLEAVIEKESTAFAVYIGDRAIASWVEPEVRLALSRSIKEQGKYPFIPILSKKSEGICRNSICGAPIFFKT